MGDMNNKEKNLDIFHNRRKSEIKPNIFLNNNNLFSFGEKFQKKDITSRKKSELRPHMTFANFIIHKKRDIEQKIIGKKMNKSSTSYYNNQNINNINSNSFNKTQINNSYRFYLNSQRNEKEKIFDYNYE